MHVEVIDTTGRVWVGDGTDGDITEGEVRSVRELLMDLSRLRYLSLEVDGVTRYFNPNNIIAVSIREAD